MARPAKRLSETQAPDTLKADVMAACERIYELAKAKKWDLPRLAKEAGRPFQSFINWKEGHHLPKIAYLQDFAQAVGANVRVLVHDAQQQGGFGMASVESRQIAALIDSRLGTTDSNEPARKQLVELVKHYLGTLPHP